MLKKLFALFVVLITYSYIISSVNHIHADTKESKESKKPHGPAITINLKFDSTKQANNTTTLISKLTMDGKTYDAEKIIVEKAQSKIKGEDEEQKLEITRDKKSQKEASNKEVVTLIFKLPEEKEKEKISLSFDIEQIIGDIKIKTRSGSVSIKTSSEETLELTFKKDEKTKNIKPMLVPVPEKK